MRLEPLQGVESLDRAVTAELPSEAMVAGAVQVPPSGRPTVLLADHPVTGGYPVIAVVRDVSLDALGQLAPGRVVRFR
jgi:allophanate hydrolase subunit 2